TVCRFRTAGVTRIQLAVAASMVGLRFRRLLLPIPKRSHSVLVSPLGRGFQPCLRNDLRHRRGQGRLLFAHVSLPCRYGRSGFALVNGRELVGIKVLYHRRDRVTYRDSSIASELAF